MDLADVVAVALAGEGVVVEVRGRRAHGAEGERVALGVAAAGVLDVVGELDADRDGEVEVGESRPAARRLADRVEEHVRGLGEERVADPPVGELAGEAQVRRAERGDVDRECVGGISDRMARPSPPGSGSW